jgi:hypothetical protein
MRHRRWRFCCCGAAEIDRHIDAAQFEKSQRRLGQLWLMPIGFLAGTAIGAIG